MNELITYNYQNSPIQFEMVENRIMANATLMARPFKKEPNFIFKTKSWKEFENAVSEDLEVKSEYLRTSKMGSPERGGGSWIHEELVIEFARRLNPKFAIWCNRTIAEILRSGRVQTKLPSRLELAQMVIDAELEAQKAVDKAFQLYTERNEIKKAPKNRKQVVKMVIQYATSTKKNYGDAYTELYKEFTFETGINIFKEAEAAGFGSKIQFVHENYPEKFPLMINIMERKLSKSSRLID
jgi:hypothetical protein